jgi:two-component system response regulator AtoC
MGAVDYVSKPFRSDEVLLKLQMALERERLVEEGRRLQKENEELRHQQPVLQPFDGVIGKSKTFTDILGTVQKVAPYKSTVLLLGESGTGKEVLAKTLHRLSDRSKKPFVPINCGAIPETLLESELFGHCRGAFTHATRDKLGLVEEAHTGTLFLDEIGELPLTLQVKLLRFLQEGEIRRVGDTKDIQVDVRVVAATSKDLEAMVAAGEFREDLFYRLNVLQLGIPPLRDRKEDIPLLVEFFTHRITERMGRDPITFSKKALKVMLEYRWPGNIRELENTLERTIVLSDTHHLDLQDLPESLQKNTPATSLDFLGETLSIKQATRLIEKELIKRGLKQTGGNRTQAAKLLEISHRALLYKIKEYGLK